MVTPKFLAVFVFLLVGAKPSLRGQESGGAGTTAEDSSDTRPDNAEYQITTGGEVENYLRYVQAMSGSASYPWSVRPLSPAQLREVFGNSPDHPWRHRYDIDAQRGLADAGIVMPKATVFFNTAFPYGSNDGPVWVGRGLTYQLQGGFFARLGPLTLILAPVLFRAENRTFAVRDTLPTCPPACGSPPYVDYPQRFGDKPYNRLDPGASVLQIDTKLLSAGVSTGSQWWGPSQEFPYILGNNAPGFPHVFFQTRRPTSIWVGRVHARVMYGRLDQSAYSPVTGSRRYVSPLETGTVRFANGVLAVFQPRGVDGLEVGIGRFFHFVWPRLGIPASFVRKPLGGFFGSNTGPTGIDENQLASLFARWVFRESGFEVYGEYGREDNSYDNRDALQEPDHARTYMLGFRKSYQVTDEGFRGFRAELINFQVPTLVRSGRGETAIYLHSFLRQGHTNRGQLLGSAVGVGSAAGSLVAWDRFSRNGRTTYAWERRVRKESGTFSDSGLENPKSTDVWHALRAERTKFIRNFDVTGGLALVKEFNRDFAEDALNLNITLAAQWRLP